MPLAPGTKLGPYEILAPLGAGGMGEVYRARDTRLGRAVAIKILPPSVSEDAERLNRFATEARVLSTLNHPNLLAIYDVGAQNGIHFIVSELLEGESLREHIQRSGIPQRKAIQFAIQIATGLAAAHDERIIHRDLKPENLFVTSDGRVKILDFGLAKQTAVNESVDDKTLTSFRDRRVHVTRAGARKDNRFAQRHFQFWGDFVRDVFGEASIPGWVFH